MAAAAATAVVSRRKTGPIKMWNRAYFDRSRYSLRHFFRFSFFIFNLHMFRLDVVLDVNGIKLHSVVRQHRIKKKTGTICRRCSGESQYLRCCSLSFFYCRQMEKEWESGRWPVVAKWDQMSLSSKIAHCAIVQTLISSTVRKIIWCNAMWLIRKLSAKTSL